MPRRSWLSIAPIPMEWHAFMSTPTILLSRCSSISCLSLLCSISEKIICFSVSFWSSTLSSSWCLLRSSSKSASSFCMSCVVRTSFSDPMDVPTLRRISLKRCSFPRLKIGWENSHVSLSWLVLWKPYRFSCLTKLAKLLCLKYLGSTCVAKTGGSITTTLSPVWLQHTYGVDALSRSIRPSLPINEGTLLLLSSIISDRLPRFRA
mmetsp:Transcript_104980/g.169096  ORF Transcript_104980/g.169096 Transcript_104980/m.169096 type:complete len:206 (-) Transcript_104980:82-699(-)